MVSLEAPFAVATERNSKSALRRMALEVCARLPVSSTAPRQRCFQGRRSGPVAIWSRCGPLWSSWRTAWRCGRNPGSVRLDYCFHRVVDRSGRTGSSPAQFPASQHSLITATVTGHGKALSLSVATLSGMNTTDWLIIATAAGPIVATLVAPGFTGAIGPSQLPDWRIEPSSLVNQPAMMPRMLPTTGTVSDPISYLEMHWTPLVSCLPIDWSAERAGL
jgi:hypothetical protein